MKFKSHVFVGIFSEKCNSNFCSEVLCIMTQSTTYLLVGRICWFKGSLLIRELHEYAWNTNKTFVHSQKGAHTDQYYPYLCHVQKILNLSYLLLSPFSVIYSLFHYFTKTIMWKLVGSKAKWLMKVNIYRPSWWHMEDSIWKIVTWNKRKINDKKPKLAKCNEKYFYV